MNKLQIECHGDAVSRQVAAKREIGVVAMPAVERLFVEPDRRSDVSPSREEHAVEGDDRVSDRLPSAEEPGDIVASDYVGDHAARMTDAGVRPSHADQTRRSRGTDDVVIREVPAQSPAQV